MRTFSQLLDAIVETLPTKEEVAALTQEQIATLRGALNGTDNILYMSTDGWRQFKAEQAQRARERTS